MCHFLSSTFYSRCFELLGGRRLTPLLQVSGLLGEGLILSFRSVELLIAVSHVNCVTTHLTLNCLIILTTEFTGVGAGIGLRGLHIAPTKPEI